MKARLSNNPTLWDKYTFKKFGLKPGEYVEVIDDKMVIHVKTRYGNIWVDEESLDYIKDTVSCVNIDRLKSMLGIK